jgi:predicted nucleotidyltransferase
MDGILVTTHQWDNRSIYERNGYTCPVDFRRPVEAVVPGAYGRILAVLVETSAEMNLRTIARLSGVSVAHASRVLPVLVELGMAERREVPPSALFRLIPENVASRAVSALADARRTVLGELGEFANGVAPSPASVVVFGSFARGEADRESDLDVVFVRPGTVDEEDPEWRTGVDGWVERARRLTGNHVELLEVTDGDAARLLRSRKQLWLDIQHDGIVVHGLAIEALRSPVK